MPEEGNAANHNQRNRLRALLKVVCDKVMSFYEMAINPTVSEEVLEGIRVARLFNVYLRSVGLILVNGSDSSKLQ